MKYAALDNSFENIYSGKHNTTRFPLSRLQMASFVMQLYQKWAKFVANFFTDLAACLSRIYVYSYTSY